MSLFSVSCLRREANESVRLRSFVQGAIKLAYGRNVSLRMSFHVVCDSEGRGQCRFESAKYIQPMELAHWLKSFSPPFSEIRDASYMLFRLRTPIAGDRRTQGCPMISTRGMCAFAPLASMGSRSTCRSLQPLEQIHLNTNDI